MKLLQKNKFKMINEISCKLVQFHAEIAAKIIKEKQEYLYNIALYHLSVIVKMSLWVLCRKHQIIFTERDSIEVLFDKTYKVLPTEILDMAEDIYYWHNDIQYETAVTVTADEAADIGRKIQSCYNDNIVPVMTEILEAEESTISTGNALAKF